ncbi:MAG: hypothetical protein JNM89_06855 [Hyphomicrobiaceae bacterium]|nr:hypothetical protein [Hyphomicrobiaceae bacterium]
MLCRIPSIRPIASAAAASVLLLSGAVGSAEAGGIWHLGRETSPRPPVANKGGPGANVSGNPTAAKTSEAKPAEGASSNAASEADVVPARQAVNDSEGTSTAGELAKEGAQEALKGTIGAVEKDAAKPEEKTAPAADAKADGGDQGKDYYRKRAEHILKGEGAAITAHPHPLAAAHPGMDVVVCQGGCLHDTAEVVYIQPTSRKAVTTVGELQTTAATPAGGAAPAAVPSVPQIVCIGGCYEGYENHYNMAATMQSGVGEWSTSVVPSSAQNRAGSGDWMRRIDEMKGKSVPKP